MGKRVEGRPLRPPLSVSTLLRAAGRVMACLLLAPLLLYLATLLIWHGAWPSDWHGHHYLSVVGEGGLRDEASASEAAGRSYPATGQWSLRSVRAQEAWEALQKRGQSRRVRIGLLDGMLDPTHPDLHPPVAGQLETPHLFARRWLVGDTHGTALWAILAGRGSPGMTGVNPDAELVVMGTHTDRHEASIASALRFFAAHQVRVANFSVATPWPLVDQQSIDEAYEAGVLPVSGLRNEDQAGSPHPASLLRVVAVSTVDREDRPVGYGWGPVLDLLAPGLWQHSAAPRLQVAGVPVGRPYRLICCNSIAVPHVTGVASLVVASDPTLTSAQVDKRLKLSARKPAGMAGAVWHERYGYGVVDAERAVIYDSVGPSVEVTIVSRMVNAVHIVGHAVDSADDERLTPGRARDAHLLGVPVSNIARVEVRDGAGGWREVRLATGAGRYDRGFSADVPATATVVEVRAWDTAGNAGPVLSVDVR